MVNDLPPICYNKDGIALLLKRFEDAISDKQYKNRIPYDVYRKIRDSRHIAIDIASGNVRVMNTDETLFYTSYKDDGFGQFFYDNYASTIQVVETKTTANITIKENDTMKMPAMNFDFGPFTEPGVVALSPYGIAIRATKGEYLTYNAATGATVDVTGFTFDFQKMIYKMPAAIKDLRAGDMVLHRGKPMYVQSVEEDGIHCIDILNSEAKVIVPVTSIFGFNYITKVVSLMNVNAGAPSADNPFGNIMPYMFMQSMLSDGDNDGDMSKMLMLSMMMNGGSTPFANLFNFNNQ
mgnify:FL=1